RVMDDAGWLGHHRGMSIFRIASALLLGVVSLVHCVRADVLDYARAPAFAFATLSPHGLHIAYVEQRDGKQVVLIRSLRDSATYPTLTVEPPRERVQTCGWVDNRFVVCDTVIAERKQHAIAESKQLYAIDTLQRRVHTLTTNSGRLQRAAIIDLMPDRAEVVLLQHDPDGRGFPEVIELNVATGKSRVLVKGRAPVRSWMSDGRGRVRVGIGYDNGIASVLARAAEADRWETFIEQKLSDPEAVGPLALGANDELFALKHHRGRTALLQLDLARRLAPKLVFSDPLYDVSGPVELDPTTRKLLAVRYLAEAPAVHVVDDEEQKLRDWLDAQLPQTTNMVNARSLDGRVLLIESSSDTNPPSLYWLDVRAKRLTLIGDQYPELEVRAHAPMRSLMYAARDGQRIPAYLTVPQGVSESSRAVVLPHGGPETRDAKSFDPLVQFLAAQGYAVLQMNFRGSLGYGAGFAAAGAREWGGVIHNDITDGARWLVQERIADPEQICIVGSSFGGYAALLGAMKESQWYACAASYAAPTDLMALSQHVQRTPQADMWRERLGTRLQALWQTSPLALAWQSETPMLLLHGRRDAVVPVSQSRRLAREFERRGKPHKYVERADCDHDQTAEACRVAVFTELRDFLAASLELANAD
ncbi:MAG TPA: prolyl oligopeptidase family serine peptidase, partial [Steroidobacteraceae bacterium]|nr:prolyl oligopeptidase family serine peptidase [Steroidobacteraceae bacterium]